MIGFKVGFIVNENALLDLKQTTGLQQNSFCFRKVAAAKHPRNYSGIARRISIGSVDVKLHSELQAGTTASSPRRTRIGASPFD